MVGWMRLAVVTLVALLAFASPALASQVTVHSVDNSTPTRAAGARTVYTVEFTPTNGIANTGRITLAFPGGTAFSGGVTSDVFVGTTDVGGCFSPVGLEIECFLNTALTAGTRARIVLGGVTNTTPAGPKTLTVKTTTDTDPAPGSFTVDPVGTVSAVALTNAPPTNAAGGRTAYEVQFTTSATGGMSGTANSRFTVTFPTGTTFTGGVASNVFVGTTDVGGCFSPVGLQIECFINTAATVAAGARIRTTFDGVTNPAPGQHHVSVATTSDPTPIDSNNVTVVTAGTVSAVALTNAPPTNAAGGRTAYEVQFTTSATGGMSGTANSRFTVTFPTGTTFTGGVASNVFVGTTDVGGCFSPVGLQIECFINTAATVAAGARIRTTFDGVTNPAPGQHHVSVATTSDPTPIDSNNVTVVTAGTVSAVALTNAPPTNAAGGRTAYEVQFTTSATGGMSGTANSRFTVTFPTGTTFTGGVASNVFVGTTDVGGCFSPVGLQIECFINTAATVAAGARIRTTFDGVTNPAPGQHHVSVATTSDPTPIDSNNVTVVTGSAVSAATVAVANPSAAAITRYVFEFTTSATGGMSGVANSRITLTFAGGTTFASTSMDVFVGTIDVGGCFSPVGLEMECFINSAASIPPNTRVRVTVDGVRNPAAGSYSASVKTTSDLPPVASGYGIGQDTVAPETTIASEGSPFTFSSNEPGSTFECSIDGGTYTPCTSPFTPPALAPGEHTLSVRAIDGAGNADTTPAVHGFVVEQLPPDPTPTVVPTVSPSPTPTATPEPTPQFNQTVVAEPVRGTVQVCPKGGTCFTLGAGQTIPMGSTVDTKKGAVELTSLSAPGAPPQKAEFSEGIFRITQRGNVTELTLTEKLAPCPKRARASAKKPKSRKLWGKGTGKFRTVGSYSAATIRGTRWLMQDSCAGTLTRVTQGAVSVRDTVKRKTVIVRAGKSYTAKPRR